MKAKGIAKCFIDFGMIILLLFLMPFEMVGRRNHGWLGMAMFSLFIVHHVLNRKWLLNLNKGRYSVIRILQTVITLLAFLSMLGSMVSAVLLIHEIFDFIPFQGNTAFARSLHMLSAYWGFIFMGLHLGFHWNMVMGMMRKATGNKAASSFKIWSSRAAVFVVSSFGIYAFINNNIINYLFLRSHFVFFDMQKSLASFLADYVAMMVLWVCVGYYSMKAIQKYSGKRLKKIYNG